MVSDSSTEAVVLLGNSGGGSLMALSHAERGIGDGWIGMAAHPGEGVFMNLPNGYTLRVEESRSGGRELYGVFAHKQDPDGKITTLTAKHGELVTGGLDGNVSLQLDDGNISTWTPQAGANSTIAFDNYNWPLNLAEQLRLYLHDGKLWRVSDDPNDTLYQER